MLLWMLERDLRRLPILRAESVGGQWMEYYRYEDVWKVVKGLRGE